MTLWLIYKVTNRCCRRLLIDELFQLMGTSDQHELATVSEPLPDGAPFKDPNCVKVVTTQQGRALYFSRAPIPWPRDHESSTTLARRHVGLYAFRVGALRRFVALGASALENIEKLEQLRWLEAGYDLWVYASDSVVPGGVDTPADLERVRRELA